MLQIEEPINVQIANDVKRVLVEEQGYPDNISTFGLAVIQIQFARLIARGKASIRAPEKTEHEIAWEKTGRIPISLSFWINTMVGAVGREKHMADMNYLFDQRLVEGRRTVYDL